MVHGPTVEGRETVKGKESLQKQHPTVEERGTGMTDPVKASVD